jgi:hypothetical protein
VTSESSRLAGKVIVMQEEILVQGGEVYALGI